MDGLSEVMRLWLVSVVGLAGVADDITAVVCADCASVVRMMMRTQYGEYVMGCASMTVDPLGVPVASVAEGIVCASVTSR